MPQKEEPGNSIEKTCLKGIGFIASGSGDANTSFIEVKNGKILRIRPTEAVRVTEKVRVLSIAQYMGEAISRISNESSVSSLFD